MSINKLEPGADPYYNPAGTVQRVTGTTADFFDRTQITIPLKPQLGLLTQAIPAGDSSIAPPKQVNSLSNGTVTGMNSVKAITPTVSLRNVQFGFSNFQNTGGTEADGLNVITVRASVQVAVGQFAPMYFNGKRDVTIDPGTTVDCDPMGIILPKGQDYYVRTFVTCASGGKFPLGYFQQRASEGQSSGTSETDLTTTAGLTSVSFSYAYTPSTVKGTPLDPPKTVIGAITDSIGAGTGDAGFNWKGWISRGLNNNYAFQNLGWGSDTAVNWTLANYSAARRRRAIMRAWTHGVIALGTNDISAGATVSQVAFRLLDIASQLTSLSTNAFIATLPPRSTTSIDNWATTAGQTIASTESIRVALNNWILDGCPIVSGAYVPAGTSAAIRIGDTNHPVAGYLDLAGQVESARNSGLWKTTNVRIVTDGVMNAGSNILTSATAKFTPADLNRAIAITDVGSAGATMALSITAYTSPTQVSVAAQAVISKVGATVRIGMETLDGLHPAQDGHQDGANALQPLLPYLTPAT